MKKALIILGPDRSGKTKMAKELASQFTEDEILWYDAKELTTKQRNQIRFSGGNISRKTKIIVLDGLNHVSQFFLVIHHVPNGINTIVPDEGRIEIDPQFVLVFDSKVTKKSFKNHIGCESFDRRFEIIELPATPEFLNQNQ